MFIFQPFRESVPINILYVCIITHITANVVLEGACERVIVRHLYSDIPMGLDVIRGENVVLTGELVSYIYIKRSCCMTLG